MLWVKMPAEYTRMWDCINFCSPLDLRWPVLTVNHLQTNAFCALAMDQTNTVAECAIHFVSPLTCTISRYPNSILHSLISTPWIWPNRTAESAVTYRGWSFFGAVVKPLQTSPQLLVVLRSSSFAFLLLDLDFIQLCLRTIYIVYGIGPPGHDFPSCVFLSNSSHSLPVL